MNIWVNGCFDILHTGHLELLWYAKSYTPEKSMFPMYAQFKAMQNNTLFVGIDADKRVKQLKGDKRPINDAENRKAMLQSLKMVDEVFIFDNDNELRKYVKALRIDYIVVGDQYKNKEVIGWENSKYGVIYYPVDMRSTTDIIEKIKKL